LLHRTFAGTDSLRSPMDRDLSSTVQPQAEERLSALWAGARDGLWDLDLARDEVHFSPRWKEILGCAEGDLPDRVEEWFRRVHPQDLGELKGAIAALMTGKTSVLEL